MVTKKPEFSFYKFPATCCYCGGSYAVSIPDGEYGGIIKCARCIYQAFAEHLREHPEVKKELEADDEVRL